MAQQGRILASSSLERMCHGSWITEKFTEVLHQQDSWQSAHWSAEALHGEVFCLRTHHKPPKRVMGEASCTADHWALLAAILCKKWVWQKLCAYRSLWKGANQNLKEKLEPYVLQCPSSSLYWQGVTSCQSAKEKYL